MIEIVLCKTNLIKSQLIDHTFLIVMFTELKRKKFRWLPSKNEIQSKVLNKGLNFSFTSRFYPFIMREWFNNSWLQFLFIVCYFFFCYSFILLLHCCINVYLPANKYENIMIKRELNSPSDFRNMVILKQ